MPLAGVKCNSLTKRAEARIIDNMAKRSKQQAAEAIKVDPVEACAAFLPNDKDALLAWAMDAMKVYHRAAMAGDEDAAASAWLTRDAVVWKLNGGTMWGSAAEEDSPSRVVARHCSAAPGDVPTWGQEGEFLIETAGMRVLVEAGPGYGKGWAHFQFHAVDMAAPFLSETGYRSHFAAVMVGLTVDQASCKLVRHLVAEKKGRSLVEPRYRQGCEEFRAGRPWVSGAVTHQGRSLVYEEEDGQGAFAF